MNLYEAARRYPNLPRIEPWESMQGINQNHYQERFAYPEYQVNMLRVCERTARRDGFLDSANVYAERADTVARYGYDPAFRGLAL